MGYNSSFYLRTYPPKDIMKLHSVLSKESDIPFELVQQSQTLTTHAKWYDFEKDLKHVSKQLKLENTTIICDRYGTEPEDITRTHAYAGDIRTEPARIELPSIDRQRLYPVTIRPSRYGGTYSAALWIALNCRAKETVGHPAWGSDIECGGFWADVDKGNSPEPVGRGNTPSEAYENLKQNMD